MSVRLHVMQLQNWKNSRLTIKGLLWVKLCRDRLFERVR